MYLTTKTFFEKKTVPEGVYSFCCFVFGARSWTKLQKHFFFCFSWHFWTYSNIFQHCFDIILLNVNTKKFYSKNSLGGQ